MALRSSDAALVPACGALTPSALWSMVSVGGDEGIIYENVKQFIYSFFLLEPFTSFLYYVHNWTSLVVADAWLSRNAAWPFSEGMACLAHHV
jgi:hypothetical protein